MKINNQKNISQRLIRLGREKVAIILVNYKDYAQKYLPVCLDSIKKQDYLGEMNIFMVDNETSEESYDFIRGVFEKYCHSNLNSESSGKHINMSVDGSGSRLGGRDDKVGIVWDDREKERQTDKKNSRLINFEIIRNKKNDGFAKGNNDGIKKALDEGFDYIALFNLDTVLEPDCVRKMVEANNQPPPPPLFPPSLRSAGQARGQKEKDLTQPSPYKGEGVKIGAVQARLMLYNNKNKINSLGNVTHFLGFGYSNGYNEIWRNTEIASHTARNDSSICYPSGAAVLFTKEALEKVGLFDEEFWMYNEDQDLGWRIWLSGFKCVLAPQAVCYHKYNFSHSAQKYYWLDRNRILAILKNYHWLTLLLITPACLAMEIGLLLFSFKSGWFKEKLKVYKYFLSCKNWVYISKSRNKVQKLRQVKDKDIIKMFSGKIWYQEIGDWKLRLINPFFDFYWRIVMFIIIW